jgi:hypothetical protein
MSQELYSIPTGPNARYNYQRNLVERCIDGAAVWGIPADKLSAIAIKRSTYEHKYSIANNQNSQNPNATSGRDDAWTDYVPLLIDLMNTNIVNNPLISADDKKALNVHDSGGNSGVSSSAQQAAPIVGFTIEEGSALHVLYSNAATPSTHSKPENVAFCELKYKIGDPAPASISECIEQYNVARSHESIVFTPEQRGKKIYAYARWVNKNGKQGPWSSMISSLIP